jgi:hypothetical protein
MRKKVFKLKAEEIKELAPARGSCIATDMITVEGERVGYMYREEPDPENAADSGWRFFSGTEDDEYANDPSNLQVYDVNTTLYAIPLPRNICREDVKLSGKPRLTIRLP